jgi:hypothetical protein
VKRNRRRRRKYEKSKGRKKKYEEEVEGHCHLSQRFNSFVGCWPWLFKKHFQLRLSAAAASFVSKSRPLVDGTSRQPLGHFSFLFLAYNEL